MTRFLVSGVLLAAIVGATVAQDKKDEKKELPKGLIPLQGTWKTVSFSFDGRAGQVAGVDPKIAVENETMKSTSGKDGWLTKGVVTVDDTKNPAEFTLERGNKKTIGIYKVEGAGCTGRPAPIKALAPRGLRTRT